MTVAKNLIVLILIAVLVSTVAVEVDAAGSNRAKLLRDGFVLTGIDGELTPASNKQRLTSTDGNDRWFFEFDSDVSGDIGLVKAGTSLELLPSAALGKMTTDVKGHFATGCRLWGRVTKYKGKNFIFPIYFLPLSEVKQPQSLTSQKSQQQETELTINEPNDVLAIPQEIIAKLATRRTVRTEQLRKGLELKADCILADRTGFISSCVMRDASSDKSKKEKVKNSKTQYAIRNTQYDIFVLDALGWNVRSALSGLRLLPCEVLERAKRAQSAEPEPLRFKVAGIVTQYKGQHYLLLQRAIRVYSHGNFGK